MKRNLVVLATAALLAGLAATDALAAGHGRGGDIGGGFSPESFRGGEPFFGNVPSAPPPVFNPSSPYTVPRSPETPVSPASRGSIFRHG
jgi:hypothetical protein